MTETHVEIETTFDVDADLVLPDLGELDGVASVVRVPTIRLVATYYDTADQRLLRSRVTLRRRTGGSDAGWHLKLPAADGRLEVRLPVGRPATRVPAQLVSLTRSIARRDELRVIARLTTWRSVERLLDADGRVLAEVALDDVVADPVGGASRREWRELEVELVEGERVLLDMITDRLAVAGARPAAVQSKIARALGQPAGELPAPQPPDRVGSGATQSLAPDSAGAVAVAYCRAQVDELFRVDPHVRLDTEDAVHRMRVAARRLRSALATFRPVLDRRAGDPLREELRWLGRALGEARDLEVLAARLAAHLDEVQRHDPALVSDGAAGRLAAELRARREAALAEAREALDSDRYLDLLDGLETFSADPPLTRRARERARPLLRSRLLADCRRVLERAAAAERLDGTERETALHEVRKASKRARYAAEAMRPALGDGAQRARTRMKRLQEVLGGRQDQAVARGVLVRLARQASDGDPDAFTFGVLAGIESVEAGTDSYAEALRRVRRAVKAL
ncbi:MAG: CHAD domain-containing protein [Kineosporiaceae bacterium]